MRVASLLLLTMLLTACGINEPSGTWSRLGPEEPCTGLDQYATQMCISNQIQGRQLQIYQFQALQNQTDRMIGQMNETQRNPVQCPLCGETYQQ